MIKQVLLYVCDLTEQHALLLEQLKIIILEKNSEYSL